MLYHRLKFKFQDWCFEHRMARQRYKRGFADNDCWGMNYWFSETFPKMILHLRDMKHGSPEMDYEEIQTIPLDWLLPVLEEAKQKTEVDEEFDLFSPEAIHVKWYVILTRIAYCLQQCDDNITEIENKYEEEYFNAIFGKDHNMQPKERFKDWWERRFKKLPDGNWQMIEYDCPEELKEKYFAECDRIWKYRESMKNEAFDLLKKYFYSLWD